MLSESVRGAILYELAVAKPVASKRHLSVHHVLGCLICMCAPRKRCTFASNSLPQAIHSFSWGFGEASEGSNASTQPRSKCTGVIADCMPHATKMLSSVGSAWSCTVVAAGAVCLCLQSAASCSLRWHLRFLSQTCAPMHEQSSANNKVQY